MSFIFSSEVFMDVISSLSVIAFIWLKLYWTSDDSAHRNFVVPIIMHTTHPINVANIHKNEYSIKIVTKYVDGIFQSYGNLKFWTSNQQNENIYQCRVTYVMGMFNCTEFRAFSASNKKRYVDKMICIDDSREIKIITDLLIVFVSFSTPLSVSW